MAGREHLRTKVPRGDFSAMGLEPPSEGKWTSLFVIWHFRRVAHSAQFIKLRVFR